MNIDEDTFRESLTPEQRALFHLNDTDRTVDTVMALVSEVIHIRELIGEPL